MIIFLAILGFLFLLLLWVLCVPIELELDTNKGVARLWIWSLGGAQLIWQDEEPIVQWNMMGFRRTQDLFDFIPNPKKKPKTPKLKPKTKKARRMSLKWIYRKVRGVLTSFQIRRFQFHLDTDNYLLNAYLFPIVYWLGRHPNQIAINFQGRNEVILQLHNRLIYILWAFIRS